MYFLFADHHPQVFGQLQTDPSGQLAESQAQILRGPVELAVGSPRAAYLLRLGASLVRCFRQRSDNFSAQTKHKLYIFSYRLDMPLQRTVTFSARD
jgi:hypothetical protein